MSYQEKDFFLLPYYDVILFGWSIIFLLYYGKHAFINIYIGKKTTIYCDNFEKTKVRKFLSTLK